MDVKTTDNYISTNSPRVRPDSRTRQPSCDPGSPKYSLTSEYVLPIHSVIIQIQSETPRTLNEAHADVKTTDMFRMFAFGFTKKRQTKTRVKIATEEQKIRFKVQPKIVARCGSSLPTPKQECDGQQQWPKFLTTQHSAYRG